MVLMLNVWCLFVLCSGMLRIVLLCMVVLWLFFSFFFG